MKMQEFSKELKQISASLLSVFSAIKTGKKLYLNFPYL